MKQLKDDGAYIILDMEKVCEEFDVWENKVGTITLLDVYGKPVESLSNWYTKYALTSTGAQLQTDYNHSTGSRYWLSDTPPESLQDFFRLMKPATSVFINQRQLAAITNTHTQENDVLRRAYQRQDHHTHQANMDIDSNFALAVQT